jgi:hypothetical protein
MRRDLYCQSKIEDSRLSIQIVSLWFSTCDLPEVSDIKWVLVEDDTPVYVLPFPLETWIPATDENMRILFSGVDISKYFVHWANGGDFHIIDKKDRFAIFRMPKEMDDAQS